MLINAPLVKRISSEYIFITYVIHYQQAKLNNN